MKLAVKNVKVCKWASEETLCFEAVVTIDGVASILASNNGRGGSTILHDMTDRLGSVARLRDYARSLPKIVDETFRSPDDASQPFSYAQTADSVVDDLVYSSKAAK